MKQHFIHILATFSLIVSSLAALPILAQEDAGCTVTALQNAVVRSQPDLAGTVQGQLIIDQSAAASDARVDAVGFIWWNISSESISG